MPKYPNVINRFSYLVLTDSYPTVSSTRLCGALYPYSPTYRQRPGFEDDYRASSNK